MTDLSTCLSLLCADPPDWSALVPLLDLLEESKDQRYWAVLEYVGRTLEFADTIKNGTPEVIDVSSFLSQDQFVHGIKRPPPTDVCNRERRHGIRSFHIFLRQQFWQEIEGRANAVNRLAEAMAMEDELGVVSGTASGVNTAMADYPVEEFFAIPATDDDLADLP